MCEVVAAHCDWSEGRIAGQSSERCYANADEDIVDRASAALGIARKKSLQAVENDTPRVIALRDEHVVWMVDVNAEDVVSMEERCTTTEMMPSHGYGP